MSNLREYRPYRVILTTTQEVVYVVDARTPEQAEDLAEEMFTDGEMPEAILSTSTVIEDVTPVDSVTSDEWHSDATGHH